ncbi:23S rRNA (guanosine(2251)-2'-O)-methyltransferase RlmB [Rhodovibrio salinarum]|uniref:23S rRNA (Guanosine(2251)-2'-O)-methyltransferase RlmB n=1 Tax=Rhodovibrio salinarum TaxID=1087 RepID=A0A934QGI3_9PROT|nr:23S rRNA (guanosine(2251)-2'-O)-methyltransferase RlmB [Rhodovibrio salinarum]MBK1696561.1 23S rRNA (guanosine(2251)-2'-O)-methyltransferase RlmB [Rhodovibrio salinarum]
MAPKERKNDPRPHRPNKPNAGAQRTAPTHGKGDRKRTAGKPDNRPSGPRAPAPDAPVWLWGGHAVLAALGNPRRRCRRVLIAGENVETWEAEVAELLEARSDVRKPEIIARHAFAQYLPASAVHQGVAVQADPLDQPELDVLLASLPTDQPAALLLLDQVSDPHNVGAVLRSAAAFGASAVVTTKRNAPGETGALAKAASGALEHVPYPHVTNLARAMETAQQHGFRLLGLAQEATSTLADEAGTDRIGLVLGAEGHGLRQKTRATCDSMVRLPTRGPVAELNVSNAAAVGLYELIGRKTG